MDNPGGGSLMRNRRLESFLDTNSTANGKQTPKILMREEEVVKCSKSDVYVDDDGWISALISCVRIVVCFLSMMVTTFVWSLILLLLLPWPYERIRQGNIYGHVTGRMLIWYRIFGQLYVLANHLRIDRTNPTAAIQSMKEVAHAVVKNNLSLIIFPEGTGSKDGRLLPFKKGFVHLALQTRLPIVPMIFTGTHRAWRKGGLHVRPAPITVKYLRPIKTDDWTDDKVNDYVRLLHDIYVENLPEAQMPLHCKMQRFMSALVCENISKVRIASRRNVSCLFWVCRSISKVRNSDI
ncbi:1-ACYL-SN-GLYCEROL-3-PHOSPHATE ACYLTRANSFERASE ALPHA [Salix purpurea]|uniref:1-ACYL-SN-GLYCEROL-3-PHOSPHATE ACYLTRANSFERASE ALPHA n=1 Tax=Salix purpurea TaxID=77065 RepID=A0A9Q0WNQ3_SALPP|nr:1-ACYL-SN-GLYCEROL-3-PHOSPHATE ACYLTRANSFERASE ALPHA [Salix purpurea]